MPVLARGGRSDRASELFFSRFEMPRPKPPGISSTSCGRKSSTAHREGRQCRNRHVARSRVPPRGMFVHAAVAHVHAIDDGIATRSAALDDPPTHGTSAFMQAAGKY